MRPVSRKSLTEGAGALFRARADVRPFSSATRFDIAQRRPQAPRWHGQQQQQQQQQRPGAVPATPSSTPGNALQLRGLARGFASTSAKMESDLQRTQLYDLHVEHKAKMVPFAGFSMPLQYGDMSHAESHNWTREKASIFDVSHMVQHHIIGPGAQDLLMKVTPSSLDKLEDNTSTLSCLLEEGTGGIMDDCVITRLGPESFYFVTNAGRRKEDLEFLQKEIEAFRQTHDPKTRESVINWQVLDNRALIALQGPSAAAVLQSLVTVGEASVEADLSTLYFGHCRQLHLTFPDGTHTPSRLLVSRTGYTGEDGFEISIPTDQDPNLPARITNLILSNPDVRLAGLAARDSLRLEAGMCLYGHDLSTAQTPPTASMGWIVSKDRRDPSSPSSNFNGSSVIIPQVSGGSPLKERRIRLNVEAGPPAREGASIVSLEDTSSPIGVVTSGVPSPSLGGANIAMGYVKTGYQKGGTELGVQVRNKPRKATVTWKPWVPAKFYKG